MRRLSILILAVSVAVFSLFINPANGGVATMADYCIVPPFVSTAVPPNIMIMLSVEGPMQGATHPDITCTGDPKTSYSCSPASCRTTSSGRHVSNCYDNTKDYYGYLDPSKCYTYSGSGSSAKFEPSTTATNHQCSGSWSGNFLNWATMTAVDAFRKALTGGNRSTDSGSETVLLGARQTLKFGHSWFPIKRIDSANLYTSHSGTIYIVRYANGFAICNNSNCQLKEGTGCPGENCFPVKEKVCSHDNSIICASSGDCGGNSCVDDPRVLALYNLKVKVCDSSKGLESNCDESSKKPEGVIQRYVDKMRFGLISYAMKNNYGTCSHDSSITCTRSVDCGTGNWCDIKGDKTRDGGVIRSNVKWLQEKIAYGVKYHDSGGNLVTCTTKSGCSNPEKEINQNDKTFNSPDKAPLINYINKFGYESGYKSKDPVSEMYYEIVRHFKNLGPSTDKYCSGLDTTDDGYSVYCSPVVGTKSWRDPYVYDCQQSAVVAINDANPWLDKRLPGTAFTGTYPGYDTDANDYGVPSNADTSIDVTEWTRKVGLYEFGSSFTMCVGCVLDGTCDWNASNKTVTNLGRVAGTCYYPTKQNSYYIAGLSYYAHTTDLRSDRPGNQTLTTYMIDTQESSTNMLVGRQNMLYLAAKFGGFENRNGLNANGDLVPDLTSEWDKDGDGFPDNYFFASDPTKVEESLVRSMEDILRRASSGTAVSVLASGEGSGATLLQAIFYPKRTIGNKEIDWSGELRNLWYYIDPRLQSSTIREDTNADKELNLRNDYVSQFYFDVAENSTKVNRSQDTDGDGDADTYIDTVGIEEIKSIWEAGGLLWSKSADSRTVYATTDGSTLMNFSTSNASTLRSHLNASNDTEATNIIGYVRGTDQTGFRNRTVPISGTSSVWKLGDIVGSTPKIQSWVKLNDYDTAYNDITYGQFIASSTYKNRGMVYGGANDGMLHAFKLGTLEMITDLSQTEKIARLTGTGLGEEAWAFIPKNALPYLKYLRDVDYCHLYYVDGAQTLFDASIEKPAGCTGDYWDCTKQTESWKTILIGSMGLGGACRNLYEEDGDPEYCTNCVKTPADQKGFSSYFALDITNPNSPSLLWEFSHKELGFATSGPAIVRIGDRNKNGRWFAVFASGPTGPIDTTYNQFMGKSDQNLKLFVLDLKTGTLVHTIDTGVNDAFGGSLANSAIDIDRKNYVSSGYYQDDAFYVGYTKESGGSWTKGGVLRVTTKEDINPANWVKSTVINNIGPVTASVARLLDRKNHTLWLYFGTGRYFYKTTNVDDPDSQRTLYGVKDPCYTSSGWDKTCTSSVGSLTDATTTPPSSEPTNGWYINLDVTSGGAERVITNPLATFSGAVFFTTFSPVTDPCAFGGNTYLWALGYKTGGAAPSSALEGKALIQVSTGSIQEVSLSTAFTEKEGRRTTAITGVPPKGQGLSVVVRPRPIKRIMQMHER